SLNDLPSRVLARLTSPDTADELTQVAAARLRSGQPALALAEAERAFGMAVAAGDRLSLVNALSTSSLACIASGRFGEVPPMLRQLRSIAGQDAESQLVADEV